MRPTHYLRKLLKLLHLAGLLRLPNYYQEEWKTRAHNVYWHFVHGFIIISITSNVACILLYSSRNLPEFLQRSFETVSFCGYYYETVWFNKQVAEFIPLLDRLDHSLCTRQPKLLTRSKKEEKLVFVGTLVLMGTIFTAIFVEALFLPLDEEDRALLQFIYDRKYGKKLPGNFYVPGVDLSEPLYYVLSSFIFFYLTCILLLLGTVCFCQFPLFCLNVEAQSLILSRYTRLIGQPHVNTRGQPIFYTDILKDEFVLNFASNEPLVRTNHMADIARYAEYEHRQKKKQLSYEKSFVRQVLVYHQKLLSLRDDYTDFMRWMFQGRALYSMVILALAVYQVFSPNLYSEKTIFKYCSELGTIMSCYFYFCHMSERWQGCNDHVRRAMEDSFWYQCTSSVQKDVSMIHVRTHNTEDFVSALGVFRACYEYFVSSVKLSYSFLNFIQLQESL